MMIINHDNFDREGPGHDDKIIAENVPDYYAPIIVKLLNEKYATDYGSAYFIAVPDDYELQIFEP